MTKLASFHKLFRLLLKNLKVPLFPSDARAPCQNKWERDNWMNVQPSKHLVLINGYTHQGQWYEADSHLSFRNSNALAECWRNYFNNQILDVA